MILIFLLLFQSISYAGIMGYGYVDFKKNNSAMVVPPNFKDAEDARRYGIIHSEDEEAKVSLGYYHSLYASQVQILMSELQKNPKLLGLLKVTFKKSALLEIALENAMGNDVGADVVAYSIPWRR